MSDKNIVIIGAGLGGLVAGAFMAKEGFKVTIIEKNNSIGGGLQSYEKFGVTFDTGMHIFGGMNEGENIHRICEHFGILDQFKVCPLNKDNNVTVYVEEDNKTYHLSFQKDAMLDSFTKYFPEQRQNIEDYINAIENISEELDLFYLRPSTDKSSHSHNFMKPADSIISESVSDKKLAALLALPNLLYAGEKGISPAYLHAAITKIFLNGLCRVAGGYSTFANALANCIVQNGGIIKTHESLSEIVTKGRNVISVKTQKGTEYPADYVISSISPGQTIESIDNETILSNTYRSFIRSQNYSASAFIINIKLIPNKLKYSNSIGVYLSGYDKAWSIYAGGSIDKFLYMTPPTVSQGEYAETLNIILPMKWAVVKRWSDTTVGHRGEDYLKFKRDLSNDILAKLSLIIPDIMSMIEAVDTSSPLTIRDYTGVPYGAMCGSLKDSSDPLYMIPVATRIPNLMLTGQSVNMHGFCGVSLTAILTCEAILGENYLIEKLNQQQ